MALHGPARTVLALLGESGYVNAAWKYDARERASKVQVSEKVMGNKDVTLSHTSTPTEGVSAVGVGWNW